MAININHKARQHLLSFLQKVLNNSYTNIESENFCIMHFMDIELEQIRESASEMIAQMPGTSEENRKPLSEDSRDSIEELVFELSRQCADYEKHNKDHKDHS